MNKPASLKTTIISRLIIPVILFLTIETVLSYFVTLHYVDVAYDRWLLDSANSLTQEVKVIDDDVYANLTTTAMEIFKWDEVDKTYFKIIAENKGVLAGDMFVPEPTTEINWSKPYFFNSTIRDTPIRVVSMEVQNADLPERVYIHVAETLNKRQEMMTDILLADLAPQLLLTLIISIYLFIAVNRGLAPLHKLANEISQRSPRDLSPIPETHVFAEVRSLTDTINHLLGRLSAAIAAQQRFIANAAHQLRTPLAGLKLQAERAQRENDIQAMQPALLQIQNSADRVSHMIAQLLALARSGPIEGDHRFKAIDLRRLARDTCIEWVPKALQKQIDLSFDEPKQPLYVKGDKFLLGELLSNLLDNAIAYGKQHGHIAVKLTHHPNPSLSVIDDGPGIPAAEVDKIFERFYRIPGSPGNGCGLGLAIVREIADLHQAQLSVDASDAGGTRIELRFKPNPDISQSRP
ncbi:sensor histidine kinase N-terminal domain-containing protein [Methylomarinum sp. Ch1-1]|uniref:histidine kinase n=1 Tax=Methylomarinum roseum TaxID=3067653 RepID=A0AAU7NYT8_9GAMM|nr:sensor histidine kinase [Methylomarinum sp. Ch1-1]MDP4521755.1 sensor histidine kinase N-terminal domain-containing protein [Methylomarinum sp. Ch1-1]